MRGWTTGTTGSDGKAVVGRTKECGVREAMRVIDDVVLYLVGTSVARVDRRLCERTVWRMYVAGHEHG